MVSRCASSVAVAAGGWLRMCSRSQLNGPQHPPVLASGGWMRSRFARLRDGTVRAAAGRTLSSSSGGIGSFEKSSSSRSVHWACLREKPMHPATSLVVGTRRLALVRGSCLARSESPRTVPAGTAAPGRLEEQLTRKRPQVLHTSFVEPTRAPARCSRRCSRPAHEAALVAAERSRRRQGPAERAAERGGRRPALPASVRVAAFATAHDEWRVTADQFLTRRSHGVGVIRHPLRHRRRAGASFSRVHAPTGTLANRAGARSASCCPLPTS